MISRVGAANNRNFRRSNRSVLRNFPAGAAEDAIVTPGNPPDINFENILQPFKIKWDI